MAGSWTITAWTASTTEQFPIAGDEVEVVYNKDGGQLKTGTLADYLKPTANEVPHYDLDRTGTPAPLNELGAKGAGEAGTIGSSAAVINAICDALAPLGISRVDTPASPDRMWSLLQAALAK